MSQISDWMSDNKGKFASLVVVLIYLLLLTLPAVGVKADFGDVLKFLAFTILPLACIWFGDALGGYTGFSRPLGPRITNTTPGSFVVFLGWVILLFPLIVGIIKALR